MVERTRYLNDDVIMGAMWEALRRASNGDDFVESGMEVTAGAGVDMVIDIAAGAYWIAGTRYTYAGGTDTVAANVSGTPRWDLVYIDSTGVVQIHQGTPHATNPKLDDLPDGDLYLASVYVISGEADIEDTEVFQWDFHSKIYNHVTEHQNGGEDEISVTDLSGLLADPQTPLSHANDKHTNRTRSLFVGPGNIHPGSGWILEWVASGGLTQRPGFKIPNGNDGAGYASFQLPEDAVGSEYLTIRAVWFVPIYTTQTVGWKVWVRHLIDNADVEETSYSKSTSCMRTAGFIYHTLMTKSSGTDQPSAGDPITFYIKRDNITPTYTGDVWLCGFIVEYTADQ